jgi:hypothetical protein
VCDLEAFTGLETLGDHHRTRRAQATDNAGSYSERQPSSPFAGQTLADTPSSGGTQNAVDAASGAHPDFSTANSCSYTADLHHRGAQSAAPLAQ